MLLLAGDLRGGRGVCGLGECHVRGQRGGGLSCPGRADCDSARSLRDSLPAGWLSAEGHGSNWAGCGPNKGRCPAK